MTRGLAALGLSAGHLHGFVMEMVIYLRLKLFQYSEVMREVTLDKSIRGNTMYQIDYGHICIATDCQTNSAFFFSQMKMLFITVYI